MPLNGGKQTIAPSGRFLTQKWPLRSDDPYHLSEGFLLSNPNAVISPFFPMYNFFLFFLRSPAFLLPFSYYALPGFSYFCISAFFLLSSVFCPPSSVFLETIGY